MTTPASSSPPSLRVVGTGEDRYRAPALDKGLDILELLSGQSSGMTRAEILKAMGRSPGEVYRMLERLVARDYVARSLEGDRYALTLKLFTLAHRYPPLRRLLAPAQPLMDGFARQAGQSCHLVTVEGATAVVVAQAHCPGNWEFGLRVGAVIDILSTASGQTLLAFMAPEARTALLGQASGSHAKQSLATLEGHLEDVRRQGYRVGDSQQVRGVQDLSVPIRTVDGAVAVLTCPFIQRLDTPLLPFEEALGLLRDIAGRLSIG